MNKAFALAALLVTFAGTAFAGDNQTTLKYEGVTAKVGAKTVALVTVEPTAGRKLNMEYPAKVKLTAPDGVTIDKASLTKADWKKYSEKGAAFEVAYTVAAAGKKTITGELKIATCTSNDCVPETAAVKIEVEAK
ncbi:hypothetical protein [Chondromyces apiculatus]|uniref:Thiol:disulfide interchange protein DsbD N-terminal domain-containing protein n=1 Tax=Chondromyces apiculatus DSM 436 TaxID=1192034 RepID=A0A017SUT8_9BACT|nr:hypothetical protein [Chondromyces apiculatus]EYF00739.1 Hypothetical protein CAP_0307 [Chondromyces apiculatus DSM 436]